MKVDFSQQLKNLNGIGFESNGVPITLGTACETALMASYPDEGRVTGDEKFARFELATKIHAGGEIEITDQEAAVVKSLVGRMYEPLLVGPIYLALTAPATPAATE